MRFAGFAKKGKKRKKGDIPHFLPAVLHVHGKPEEKGECPFFSFFLPAIAAAQVPHYNRNRMILRRSQLSWTSGSA
jgi:hypothetical protein